MVSWVSYGLEQELSLTLLPAFPPTGLLHPALIQRYIPSLIATCSAMFSHVIFIGDLLFPEGKQRRSGSGEEVRWEEKGLRGEEGRETAVGM